MNVIRLTATSDPDGVLRLQLPVGAGEFEVIVAPKPSAIDAPEKRGWPPGFLESTYGSIQDESFVAPPRDPVRHVEPLD